MVWILMDPPVFCSHDLGCSVMLKSAPLRVLKHHLTPIRLEMVTGAPARRATATAAAGSRAVTGGGGGAAGSVTGGRTGGGAEASAVPFGAKKNCCLSVVRASGSWRLRVVVAT